MDLGRHPQEAAVADTSGELRFPIRLASTHRLHLALRGMTPERSVVTLTPDEIRVRAGTWTHVIQLEQVVAARVVDSGGVAVGVHDHLHGRWTVAGDSGPRVRLDLGPSDHAFLPPVTCLELGVDDPEDFLTRLLAMRPDLDR